ncbi:MAG: SlyX family protein [Alphaproteobacteria bacterium]|jgi:SlyX protein|nr:SlyX family protein [Alphaproteobacteria bacterium]MDP7223329.1 SlyX family protein [Alphaproteobacteria bacterium]
MMRAARKQDKQRRYRRNGKSLRKLRPAVMDEGMSKNDPTADAAQIQNDKIQSLEIAMAHQEQQIHELSDIVTAQWKDIERLRAALRKTEAKIEAIQDDIDNQSGDDGQSLSVTAQAARDKPPHY